MSETIRTQSLPLTAAQLEFWGAAAANDPPDAVSFASEYVEIHGSVSPQLFRQALCQVVEDSETLRACFVDTADGPRQIIHAEAPGWELPFHDLTMESDPKSAALAWMERTLMQPVELSKWPLFAFALFKVSDNCFIWLQSYPHIMMDGFGLMLIARRVAEVYTALVAGQAVPPHGFLPLSVLLEENENYRASGLACMDQARWHDRFADSPASVTLAGLPLLASRYNMQDIRRTSYLSLNDTNVVMNVVRNRIRSTLAQFIAAVTAAYVHRMTERIDIVLGVVAMVRTASRERRVPGLAANMLPFRLTVTPTMSIAELSQQAAQEMAFMKKLQRYRGGTLMEEISSLGNVQGVFGTEVNVMCFDYHLHFSGHSSTTHNLAAGTTDDIMINVSDRRDGRGLRVDFDGSPQYYTLDGLSNHQSRFLNLLKCAAAFPDMAVGELDLRLPHMRTELSA